MEILAHKKGFSRNRIIWCLVILVVLYFSTYRFYGTSGYVFDENTKEPIEGAVVVLAWRSWSHFIVPVPHGASGPERQIALKEAVTDENGRFRFSPFIRFKIPMIEYVPKKHEPRRFVVTENIIYGNTYSSSESKDVYIDNSPQVYNWRRNDTAQSILLGSERNRKCADKYLPLATKKLSTFHQYGVGSIFTNDCENNSVFVDINFGIDQPIGIAPYITSFYFGNKSDKLIDYVLVDYEGDSVIDFDSRVSKNKQLRGVLYRYELPGDYRPTIKAVFQDGSSETRVSNVRAIDLENTKIQLLDTWKAMNDELLVGNIDGAIEYVHSSSRHSYQELFLKNLTDEMTSISKGKRELSYHTHYYSTVEYILKRTNEGVDQLFTIKFKLDNDGAWRFSDLLPYKNRQNPRMNNQWLLEKELERQELALTKK